MSRVFGTNTPQEAALDPEITNGTRKEFTSLDGAGLTDIGWSVNEPVTPTYHPADFNQDHFVNGADLTRWRTWFGPSTMANADGDADSDGNDFLLWQRAVGATTIAPTTGGVPEPSGVALLAWAALLIAGRVRRRT
jgi:MYXO-CTERM domain-containing protein